MQPKYPGCDCDNCSLKGRPFVPPEGVGREVCVLGEAPGKTEVIRRAPFVGDSGKILRTTLKHLGLEVHLTNSCLCQPLGNATPGGADIRACWRGRAKGELADARLVVGVGNVPLEALTGEKGITTRRGTVRWHQDLEKWVLFTYHPAYLLRFADAFPDFLADLSRVSEVLKWPPNSDYDPCPMGEWEVAQHPADGHELLRRLFPEDEVLDRFVSLDLETTSLEWRKAKIVCGAITNHGVTGIFDEECWHDPQWRQRLNWLLGLAYPWTYQNGSFDVKVLKRNGFNNARCVHDTMLMHYAMDERKGTHSLEQLERKYLGVDKYKDDFEVDWQRVKEKYGKEAHYGLIRRPVLLEYNGRDAYYTWKLATVLWGKMDESQRALYKKLLIPLNNAKMSLEMGGIKFDVEAAGKKEGDVSLEVDLLRRQMGELTGHPGINPGSSQQMCVVLYDELKTPKFRGRQRTTNKDALAVIRKRLPSTSRSAQVIDLLRTYRQASKLLSTYLTGFYKWIDDDGMVRTEYLVHGTPTGRFASRNPNLQNIPRRPDIRDLFVARQGFTLIEADYSQAELRVLAVLSGDKVLMKIFADGLDLHDEVAVEFYGPNFTKDERVRAKAVNFGIGYGRTAESIAEEYNIPLLEAKRYVVAWFARFPDAARYIKDTRAKAIQGEPIVNPSGRRRHFPLILPGQENAIQNEANNFPMQSTASDLTQMSMIDLVYKWELYYDRRIALNNHDALLAEVEDCVVDECVGQMVGAMEYAAVKLLGSEVRFIVDVKVGKKWGSLKKIQGGEDELEPVVDVEENGEEV